MNFSVLEFFNALLFTFGKMNIERIGLKWVYGQDEHNLTNPIWHMRWHKMENKLYVHPEKCFVESTKISIGPYLNEKLC